MNYRDKPMVTLALIGLGAWGKKYVQAASQISSCRIRYVCSVHVDQHHDISDIYKRVSDYRELIRHDLDGVIIATPAETHYEIANFFLEHNKNVLIEKPLTLRYRDALSLQRVHAAHPVVALVNHIYLYNPAVVKIRTLLQSLGNVIYIESEGGDLGPFRTDVSPLWDWAPHDISLALQIAGDKPISVRAWSVKTPQFGKLVDSLIYIELAFRKFPVFIKISSLFPTKKRTFTVFGTKAALVFNDVSQQKLTLYSGERYEMKAYPAYDNAQPLVRAVSDFVSCIKNKKRPVSDLSTSVKTIRIIDAVERSLRVGGKIISII